MIEFRSAQDLIRLLYIYRAPIRRAAFACLMTTIAGAFLLPARYESEARLLIKPNLLTTTLPIEATDRNALVAPSTQRDPLIDEERMLTSKAVVGEVARKLLEQQDAQGSLSLWKRIKRWLKGAMNQSLEWLRELLSALGLSEYQSPQERLQKSLEKNFSAKHEAGSSVIEIQFAWDDPVIAQQIVNVWIAAYLKHRSQALERPNLFGFYESEAARTRVEIDQLQTQLVAGLSQVGSHDVSERLASLAQQTNLLNRQHGEKQIQLAGVQAERKELKQLEKKLPKEITVLRQISLNPARQDLQIKLNDLLLQRAELLRVYRDSAPAVNLLNASIERLQESLRAQVESVQSYENRVPNEEQIGMQRRQREIQVLSDSLLEQLAGIDRRLSAIASERKQLLEGEPELNYLQLQLETAQRNLQLYLSNLEKARIDRELLRGQIESVATIEPATLQPARVFPKSPLILLLSIPASLLAGLLVGYLCYLVDDRIHDASRLAERLGLPLWGELPVKHHAPHAYSAHLLGIQHRLNSEVNSSIQQRRVGLTAMSASYAVKEVIQALGQEPGLQTMPAIDPSCCPTALLSLRGADIIVLLAESGYNRLTAVTDTLRFLQEAGLRVSGVVLVGKPLLNWRQMAGAILHKPWGKA